MSKFINKLKKLMGSLGVAVEESHGEDLLPKARVKNDPTVETVEKIEVPQISPKLEKQSRELQHKRLKRRFKNFTEGVDVFKNFEKIDIELMDSCKDWNYFEAPDSKQFCCLMGSIETIGIIYPLILVKRQDGKYDILDGFSRAQAAYNLYKRTNDEKYKFAPAFVLNAWEVDEYYKRILILDCNIPYRTISQETFIKAIIERHELLKRTKQFRSESNIAETLAEEFMISKSSVYNYLCLGKLSEEVMVLLLDKSITLQTARYLSRVNHKVQTMILDHFGVERLNEVHRMKFLTGQDDITLPKLEKKIEIANSLLPPKTSVTVTMEPRMLKDYLEHVSDFKSESIKSYEHIFQTSNGDSYCKVSYDENHMKDYLEKGLIDQNLLDRVNAKNREELKRCRG